MNKFWIKFFLMLFGIFLCSANVAFIQDSFVTAAACMIVGTICFILGDSRLSKMIEKKHYDYTVNTEWNNEDNCYIASMPDHPGLSAHGDTKLEAIAEALIALDGFLEVKKEDKDD